MLLTDLLQVKMACVVVTLSDKNHLDVAESLSDAWSWSDAVEEIVIVDDAEVTAAVC